MLTVNGSKTVRAFLRFFPCWMFGALLYACMHVCATYM